MVALVADQQWWNLRQTNNGGTCCRPAMVELAADKQWWHLLQTNNGGTCDRPTMVALVADQQWWHLWQTNNGGTCGRAILQVLSVVEKWKQFNIIFTKTLLNGLIYRQFNGSYSRLHMHHSTGKMLSNAICYDCHIKDR